jgi:Flp pilus assembly protein TadG
MALKRNDNTGTSAVEFALILPWLGILLLAIIEFGIVFYDQAVITNASREGARAGIVYRYPDPVSDDEIRNVVLDYCAGHLITFKTTPSLNIAITPGIAAGDPITVTVQYDYQFLVLPRFLSRLPGNIPLVATTVMRME